MQGKNGILTKDLDAKNLKKIAEAFDNGRIDAAARDYLIALYSDSAGCFRFNFHFLGHALSAPKSPVYSYDSAADTTEDKELTIADVNPDGTWLVYHRFDNDPLRNQFFTYDGTSVKLFVSSIVSAIVASQKSIGRALDKITGKYYDDYLDEVLAAIARVLSRHQRAASVKAIQDKITAVFRAEFVSSAAGAVLKIIGNLFPEISVDLVRELDVITPPYARLNDAYRMKLLFDAVPQINAFIDYVKQLPQIRIAHIKNKFYNLDSESGYRDAKIIALFEHDGNDIPLEIIMNVRTFFDAERTSHGDYEDLRAGDGRKASAKNALAQLHHNGIVEYNKIICQAVANLMHRVGWNIMYERELHTRSFFKGFPEVAALPYDSKIVDAILEKMDDTVKNEVFHIPYGPRPLSVQEEIQLFRYIAQFVLFAALPYSLKFEEIKNFGFSGKVFNFVMKELYRYYENDVL